MLKLKEFFEDNVGQIVNLEEIVEDIKFGNGGDFGLEGLKFIEVYGGYMLKVDEDLLKKIMNYGLFIKEKFVIFWLVQRVLLFFWCKLLLV